LQRYHKRSNVESAFSMMKRKFGDSLRSKTDVAMVNETLCKILCHNLVVLIHEMCELGIDPVFWPNYIDKLELQITYFPLLNTILLPFHLYADGGSIPGIVLGEG
jgi:hypothetical protein